MFSAQWIPPQVNRLLMVLCCMLSLAVSAEESRQVPDHALWNALLSSYVISLPGGKSTQVNYSGFAHAQSTLDSYLQSLSAIDQQSFDQWDKADQLAFLINAYNAWTVKLILKDYSSIKSIKELGSLFESPWKKEFIPLLGKIRSLDDIEHGLIRGSGRYAEPRIHFAINCASVGCPALREEAYVGHKLDAQLEHQTYRFLSDRTRNRLEGNTLKISSIFKWYREDFELGWRGSNTLEAFLAIYAKPLGLNKTQIRQLQQDEIDIEFMDYDWRLNRN